MKANTVKKMALTLVVSAIMAFNTNISALASTDAALPTVAKTRPWDSIVQTLGGVPESVPKIEYAGSIFYLGSGVSEEDFLAVLAVGPEALMMRTAPNSGKLYKYPVYILWNSDKTILLVHPVIYDYDDVLEAVAIPTMPPASLADQTLTPNRTPKAALTAEQEQALGYMLSDEYADAVRDEFYKLLNEHRVANGLRALEVSLELQEYADLRTTELRVQYSHTRPDGSAAGSGWHNSQNYINSRYAENISNVGSHGATPDPAGVAKVIFTRWKNSSGHNTHMLWNFDPHIKMAFGITPELDETGFVTSGAVFATGY